MKNIVEIAAGSDQFKTLVAAVKAAGLVETLQGTGPFTVFAPTDDAFAKLPAGTVEGLLKDLAEVKQRPDIPCGRGQGHGEGRGRCEVCENGTGRRAPCRCQPRGQDQQRHGHEGRYRSEQWCHPRDRHRAHPGLMPMAGQAHPIQMSLACFWPTEPNQMSAWPLLFPL